MKQHQERHRDLVDQLDTPDAALVEIDGLRQAIASALLVSGTRRSDLVEAEARHRRQQEGLRLLHVHLPSLPAHPRLLDHVLGERHVAEHSIGEREERGPVPFEDLASASLLIRPGPLAKLGLRHNTADRG